MNYLFIDTSANNLIISIIKNYKIVYSFEDLNNNETSTKVMPAIEAAFLKSKLEIRDIDKIFVVNGPGSFTGIRVGVTIAKVIGYCLNIPIIPISELELLATTYTNTEYIVPIIDARRGYVYGAIYDRNLNIYLNEQYILLDNLKEKCPLNSTVINNENMDINLLKIIKKHELDKPINPHTLNPNYLKKTEAEENLNDKRN